MTSETYFAEPDSPQWVEAWLALKAEFGDEACENRSNGEVWQYMGTFSYGGTLHHEFRHRDFPGTGQRLYRRYPAS